MKKTVSLIGSDTILGKSLTKLNKSFTVIEHSTSSLVWKKPFLVEKTIGKGFPDVYILCYSILDNAEVSLLSYLRTVTKVAKKSKAKVIGFVDYKIFDGNVCDQKIDETVKPFPESQQGKLQFTFEERLLRYSNSLIFRLGEFWSENTGFVIRKLKECVYECPQEDCGEFSLTSEESVLEAITIAIENDMVFIYNLVDACVATVSELLELFKSHIKIKLPPCMKEGLSVVLDHAKWDAMSMTQREDWRICVKRKIPHIVKNLYGT